MQRNQQWIEKQLHGEAPKDRDFMVADERRRLQAGREEGTISLFRVKKCARPECKEGVLEWFKFCSKECTGQKEPSNVE